ncbi:MAG: DNA/RNA nuclease SfsA [Gammaproteobacteria bacterium]|nr:MAG: DNA/RNA nuclease SfsA [Gammaproteobacteria bacterium]
MRYDPPLVAARLLRRYKRFLADVETASGDVLTLHCPNTGSMRNCMPDGARVWYSTSDKPGRKYRHTWEQVQTPAGDRIGIHTGRANTLVAEALAAGRIPELADYPERRAEVKMGRSRLDFVLTGAAGVCHLEVKSVTLLESGGLGLFPDAVSERARRHLEDLAARAEAGLPAALLYCVQHTGIRRVAPADAIDPAYGETLRRSIASGVQVLAWQADLSPTETRLVRPLPVLAIAD